MKTILHDVSLRMHSDEHLVILGPNGCGKSTLIKTLTCECYPLARPETRVRIFGRERWELFELRKRLGIVEADLPRESTLHYASGATRCSPGFFASSTLWPGMEVTERDARARRRRSWIGWRRSSWQRSRSARCPPGRCAAS